MTIHPWMREILEMLAEYEEERAREYDAADDFGRSIDLAYEMIRARKASGGPGWEPK